eukprot:3011014-Pyramimonas_sp.AAC.1
MVRNPSRAVCSALVVVYITSWKQFSYADSHYTHHLGQNITIADNVVPWGSTLCITPQDLVPCVNDTSGCTLCDGDEPCSYSQLVVKYGEQNDAMIPVPSFSRWRGPFARSVASPDWYQYINAFVYDGVDIYHHPLYANLDPAAGRVEHNLTFRTGSPSNSSDLLRFGLHQGDKLNGLPRRNPE